MMIQYIIRYHDKFLGALLEHILLLYLVPLTISILLGVVFGLISFNNKGCAKVLLMISNIFQTIPSLAMLAILVVLGFGIGYKTAIIAIVLYSVLPIMKGTLVGLESITLDIMLVSRSLGMNTIQIYKEVLLPVALPSIISSVRVVSVMMIGMGTLAAMVGAGGLGQFILTGLSQLRYDVLLVGAVPSTLLALLIDFIFSIIENKLTKWSETK